MKELKDPNIKITEERNEKSHYTLEGHPMLMVWQN
jgi:hypothetical protein